MKRTILPLLIFLIGCERLPFSPILHTPSQQAESIRNNTALAALNSFQYDPQCPRMCWMGINPGVTTTEAATTILKASGQVDRTTLKTSERLISVGWYTDATRGSETQVDLAAKDGLVDTVAFSDLPFTVKDFTELLGQPDQIRFMVLRTAETTEVIYAMYFSSQRVMIESGGQSGPQALNPVAELWLNMDFSDATFPEPDWSAMQAWLGYGHIREYLPALEIPSTGAAQTPSP